jgi:hypothetical protein
MLERLADWLIGTFGFNGAGWVLICVVFTAGTLTGWTGNGWRLDARHASAQAAWNEERAALARAAADASEAARTEERRRGEAMAKAAADHLRRVEDAKDKARHVAADLRADVVRLRQQWAGCETRRVSGVAAGAAESDDTARLRIEGAARIVRAAAECDAHVAGLQSALRGERENQRESAQ